MGNKASAAVVMILLTLVAWSLPTAVATSNNDVMGYSSAFDTRNADPVLTSRYLRTTTDDEERILPPVLEGWMQGILKCQGLEKELKEPILLTGEESENALLHNEVGEEVTPPLTIDESVEVKVPSLTDKDSEKVMVPSLTDEKNEKVKVIREESEKKESEIEDLEKLIASAKEKYPDHLEKQIEEVSSQYDIQTVERIIKEAKKPVSITTKIFFYELRATRRS